MKEVTIFNKIKNLTVKGTLWIATVAVLGITALNSYTVVDAGEKVRIQNTITGTAHWYQEQGTQLKTPFFSSVSKYNSVSTIAVTDDEVLIDAASAVREPLPITFADNYGGIIEASWRVRLSSSEEQLEQMHQEVKSQTNLQGNTFLTFAKDMLNLTTDQFLAQDFMQGGKGAFKQSLQDQATYGMLVTKRERVVIDGLVADQSTDGSRSQSNTTKQYTYKVVPQVDKDGNKLRRPHSLSKYGIEVTQVDLGEFLADTDLLKYTATIKGRERERADMIADQRSEREKAMNAQLKGETARITAKNTSLMIKDREVITGQKEVELAGIKAEREVVEREKVAKLAKIDKQRELDIALSNKGIQEANYEAAKFEAQATREQGFAEADVASAKLKAKQASSEIYLAELSLEAARVTADAVKTATITAPQYVNITNGEGAAATTVADLLSTKLVKDIVGN